MNDQQQQQPGQDDQSFLNIRRVYLKDLSLEQPNSSHIFLKQEQPSVEAQADVAASQLAEGVFEVTVIDAVTTKVQKKMAFLVEAKQTDIFDIRNVPAEQMDPLLDIAYPTIIYPCLRSNITDTIGHAGFQSIHLAEISLQTLYEQCLAAAIEQQDRTGGTGLVMPDGSKATHQVQGALRQGPTPATRLHGPFFVRPVA